jgi:hypothetical protein
MMIALAILAMGLLVIGAALPIGMRYTRASINMATGEAAAEYALDTIEQNVAIPRRIWNPTLGVQSRETGLFVPRFWNHAPDPNAAFDPNYEPIIKVRPLFTQNLIATAGPWHGQELYDPTQPQPERRAVLVEEQTRACLRAMLAVDPNSGECDPSVLSSIGNFLRPAATCASIAYPPVAPDVPFGPLQFLTANPNDKYIRWPVSASEARRTQEQRTLWTAFYRRVSHATDSDPFLYEFIVISTRLPSSRHRFPVQNPDSVGNQTALGYLGIDTAAPIPWLVFFDPNLPAPPNWFDTNGFPAQPWSAPATLTFTCSALQSGLFPVGAIIIPARNDQAPPAVPSSEWVRFSPLAPTVLPVYEVVERPDQTSVVVKYNGYYPMQGDMGTYVPPPPLQWPVWVIPPAFEELSGGEPVFPNRSPIVAVARRYMRLREVP